jgi:hypothetical protein
LTRQGDGTIPERRALLESHYHMVRARIQELRDNLAVIEHKIHIYSQVEA